MAGYLDRLAGHLEGLVVSAVFRTHAAHAASLPIYQFTYFTYKARSMAR